MERAWIGVLGATGLVAKPLWRLLNETYSVLALSRQGTVVRNPLVGTPTTIGCWISLIPILALPSYFKVLSDYGARRIVALSSTTVFAKANSKDRAERALARSLEEGEQRFIAWAERGRVEWLILRPTLIYGAGLDRNVSKIAGFISRFGFFPVLGSASGLREPIHAEDVAVACKRVLETKDIVKGAYNIAGGEILTYREMLVRIFRALGREPRIITAPNWAFFLAVNCMHILPQFRGWSTEMAQRMNVDLTFDYKAGRETSVFHRVGLMLRLRWWRRLMLEVLAEAAPDDHWERLHDWERGLS